MPRIGTRPAAQQGQSLSALVSVLLVALFAVVGLVVDGGAQSAARARVQSSASQAARAAMDAGSTARAAGVTPSSDLLTAAAQESLSDQGVEGTVIIERESVRVQARASVPTIFLSLIGITSLSASGEAVAELRA